MKRTTVRMIMLMLGLAVTLTACAPYQYSGGTAGGAMGGIAGAILDRRNPWRGGVIGAALGSIAGATISEISVRGAGEAVREGRPVEYRTETGEGHGRYYAEPVPQQQTQTKCRKVRERIYEGDRLVKDHIKEVCEGEKTDSSY